MKSTEQFRPDWPSLLIGLQNDELPFHSERLVNSWIEETFIWILVALFVASITKNLTFETF